ncbi:hypothetical protein I547_0566 [Mycobacterium kansasii 824]|nr:hypothetical protein I547_0566 [Mycobacterium kansasii 824]
MPKSIPTLIAPNFRPDTRQSGTTRVVRRAVGSGDSVTLASTPSAPGEETMAAAQLHRVDKREEAW